MPLDRAARWGHLRPKRETAHFPAVHSPFSRPTGRRQVAPVSQLSRRAPLIVPLPSHNTQSRHQFSQTRHCHPRGTVCACARVWICKQTRANDTGTVSVLSIVQPKNYRRPEDLNICSIERDSGTVRGTLTEAPLGKVQVYRRHL